MATHSSILAWRIHWTGEPGGLQPTGLRGSDTTERLTHRHHHGARQRMGEKGRVSDTQLRPEWSPALAGAPEERAGNVGEAHGGQRRCPQPPGPREEAAAPRPCFPGACPTHGSALTLPWNAGYKAC